MMTDKELRFVRLHNNPQVSPADHGEAFLTVAGLAAYFKGLSSGYMSLVKVKRMIMDLARLQQEGATWPFPPPVARNGVGRISCNAPQAKSAVPTIFQILRCR